MRRLRTRSHDGKRQPILTILPTLYFVWTQYRQDYSNPGKFYAGQDITKLFTAPANNIFMVRMSYWLSR